MPPNSMPAPLRFAANIFPIISGIRTLESLVNGEDFRGGFAGLLIYALLIAVISTRTFRYAAMLVRKRGSAIRFTISARDAMKNPKAEGSIHLMQPKLRIWCHLAPCRSLAEVGL